MNEYTTRTEPIKRPPYWDQLKVEIVRSSDGVVLGSYVRGYPSLFKTFHPFELAGKSLALYSPANTATRIMELPSCRDLGGEEPHSTGFCPVEYYVPPGKDFGFVAGCVWGDDSSWKIQFLDLSRRPRDRYTGRSIRLPRAARKRGASGCDQTDRGPWRRAARQIHVSRRVRPSNRETDRSVPIGSVQVVLSSASSQPSTDSSSSA